MSVDRSVYELARSFGTDRHLTDAETARLAQHLQEEVESEIEYLLTIRKEPHGITHHTR